MKEMKHKHDWVKLMPDPASLPTQTRIDLYIDTIGDVVLFRTVVCWCGKTAHRINSHRGGFRVHQGNYFLNKAVDLSKKYDFQIPLITDKAKGKSQ